MRNRYHHLSEKTPRIFDNEYEYTWFPQFSNILYALNLMVRITSAAMVVVVVAVAMVVLVVVR